MRLLRSLKPLSHSSLLAFACAALLLLLVSVVVNAFVNYGTVYPTPETQSSFLKTYLPAEVIEGFDAHRGSSRGDSMGSGAGRGFATHNRTVDFYFVTRPENASLISKSLCDDAVFALQGNQMRVADRAVATGGGCRVHYSGGNTEGTVAIDPIVAYDKVRRSMPLPSGERDVKAEIRIEEKWVK
jgi:hypothetical protein